MENQFYHEYLYNAGLLQTGCLIFIEADKNTVKTRGGILKKISIIATKNNSSINLTLINLSYEDKVIFNIYLYHHYFSYPLFFQHQT
jgi:hypothetical protein